MTDSKGKSSTSANQVQVKNLEAELIHIGSIKLKLKIQRPESREEQDLEILQEKTNPNNDIGHEVTIPPIDSIQWSTLNIRKKGKKKSYKFWKTPSNGKDMFASDREDNGPVTKVIKLKRYRIYVGK